MRLLQVTGTLDPAYGGPPVVVEQISRTVARLGHTVDVVTLDAPHAAWLTAQSPSKALGPVVRGYRWGARVSRWLKRHVAAYDAVIVHGVWQYHSLATRRACRRAGVPYFLYVHGALDPWFQQRYPRKHLKKAAYWRLVESRVVRDAAGVLYTTEDERRLARTAFTPYQACELVVPMGIPNPAETGTDDTEAFLAAFPGLRGKRIILFLGRLHPKKGCDLLIEAFARVAGENSDLRLVLAGPDEAGTRAALEKQIRRLGITERVVWTGMLSGNIKWGAYRAAEVFALVSHSENFGVVVPEALSTGLPVLLSDKVNIWREIDRSGAGFVAEDTVDGAIGLLRKWLDLEPLRRHGMRERARCCFAENFDEQVLAAGLVGALSSEVSEAAPR
jgi:glycosyltransferase involved in cell wall biosynthesis